MVETASDGRSLCYHAGLSVRAEVESVLHSLLMPQGSRKLLISAPLWVCIPRRT